MNDANKMIASFLENFHAERDDCMDSSLSKVRDAVAKAVESVDKRALAHDLVMSYTDESFYSKEERIAA